MKALLFTIGFLLLLATEIARVYYIMPFPGSQQANTIDLAYFIHTHLGLFRLVGIIILIYPMYMIFKGKSKLAKISVGILLLAYGFVFYMFNFKFLAEKMFRQPVTTKVVPLKENKIPGNQLVIGVSLNGESRAYPIEVIGYHHQVRDSLGGTPIMVTYCTVCRTGRVYSPVVDGKTDLFRLVGMDHFNAMFEDSRTGSWWRQVNGEAVAGELKGKSLAEIPSEQMKLDAWVASHSNTLVMQEDTVFARSYFHMRNYDEGKEIGGLTGTDTVSWKEKSWVIGVPVGATSKAYDWIDLKNRRVINDAVASVPLVVAMESDTASFHVWNRVVGKDTLTFTYDDSSRYLVDTKTHSQWNWSGACIDGSLKGSTLGHIQSYQEYWHSWRTFHPQTLQFKGDEQ